MKISSKVVLTAGWLLGGLVAEGAIFQSFTENTSIQAGNPAAGLPFTEVFTQAPAGSLVESVTVGLNISGGYNGDFYLYLVAPNGALDMLMNQPGTGQSTFGASGAGMNITLDDLSPNGNIQNVTSPSVLSGSYQPQSPLAGLSRSAADGKWTLFFADVGSGGSNPELNSWSLGVTVVPEPVTPALGLFAISVLAVGGARWLMRRPTAQGARCGPMTENPPN